MSRLKNLSATICALQFRGKVGYESHERAAPGGAAAPKSSSSSSSQWSGFLLECTVDQRRGKETTSSLPGKNS